MNKAQINNSHFDIKVQLRINTLPEKKELTVLDCYADSSLIWKSISKKINKKINIAGIDKKQYGKVLNLKGDNLKFLSCLDLTRFDIIDLDAYGSPYKQLKIIFNKNFNGIIYITFIQSDYGKLNKRMLIDLGYTKGMIDKCPTLFDKNGFSKFKNWLANEGIKKIKSISIGRKNYITMGY